MRRHSCGFTLYELAITLLAIAIVASLGLPELSRSIARTRQSTEINALFHAIHLARKESIVRRQVVSICPSFDGLTCMPGSDWSGGWIMFNNRDKDEPPRIDAGEPVIQSHRVTEAIRITANRQGFTLRSTEKRATNGTIVVCDVSGRIPAKALVLSYTGRPRVAVETTRGTPYFCAD